MSTTVRHVRRPVTATWEAVSDPRTYPEWLVGCREIRSVDDAWPEEGSGFHHRVGVVGPMTLPDSTEVLEVDAPHLLALRVRARPFITARVEFRLEPTMIDGDPATRISITEFPVGPFAPLRPVLDPLISARNRTSLNALVAHLNSPGG